MRTTSFITCGIMLLLFHPLHGQTIPAPDITISGEESDNFGWSVSGVGDINNDGFDDLFVGAPASPAIAGFAGRAFLFFGPIDGELVTADADVVFNPEGLFGDNFGIAVANAGDVNNDGNDDLLVGARSSDAGGIQSGKAYLYNGPFAAGTIEPEAAEAVFIGNAFDELGWSLASAGDMNNDGFDDIIIGCPQAQASLGRVLLFNGPLSGSHTPADADASIMGEIADERLGSSVAGGGDTNHDGFDDVVIGQFSPLIPVRNTGRALVFRGPLAGSLSASDADAQIIGEIVDDRLGISVTFAGDINSDGNADIFLGADQFWSENRGKAYLFHGPVTGIVSASEAVATIRGERNGDQFGTSVRAGDDLNGDQIPDLIIGAANAGASRSGSAYVFFGPLLGNVSAADANILLEEEGGGGWFGNSVSPGGDLDDDGTSDVVIGAPLSDMAAPDAGRVYVFAVGSAVPCQDVLRFRVKCRTDGRLLIGANLAPGSGHEGKGIGFLIDGTQVVRADVVGDLARVEVQATAAGSHTVEMTDPPDCLPPVVATCSGSEELTMEDQESALLAGETLSLKTYPNPFNGETIIRFQIPDYGRVSVRIYNILGSEVATLQDGYLNAGIHSVHWNANSETSGVYFCRIEAGAEQEMIRLILMK